MQLIQPRYNHRKLLLSLANDPVFSLSLLLALLSCFFAPPKPEYLDFKVLACLFNLMVVVKAFEELRLLDKLAVGIINQCTDSRRVSLVMILLSFFSSMLITNDVALITLVPLTLLISRKTKMNVLLTVIIQTLAANIGSSMTPMGNPQNLYIVSYYGLSAAQFFPPVILFSAVGLIWICILNLINPKIDLEIQLDTVQLKDGAKAIIWAVLFGLIILSVFGIVNYFYVLCLTVFITLILRKELLLKIDYLLLLTFVCFFLFIGNASHIPVIISFMELHISGKESVYLGSILLSQVVSNVPCTIFLSKFTFCWRELLLGVNVGGMGTIVASLASIISYKLYVKENPQKSKKYILEFSLYNVLSLVLFALINYFIIRFV